LAALTPYRRATASQQSTASTAPRMLRVARVKATPITITGIRVGGDSLACMLKPSNVCDSLHAKIGISTTNGMRNLSSDSKIRPFWTRLSERGKETQKIIDFSKVCCRKNLIQIRQQIFELLCSYTHTQASQYIQILLPCIAYPECQLLTIHNRVDTVNTCMSAHRAK